MGFRVRVQGWGSGLGFKVGVLSVDGVYRVRSWVSVLGLVCQGWGWQVKVGVGDLGLGLGTWGWGSGLGFRVGVQGLGFKVVRV